MMYNILFLFILFLFSCDFNEGPVSVDNINQDALEYKKFNLNLFDSDTIHKLPSVGESLLIYSGKNQINSNVYSLFSFDNEVFSNYDLCSDDTISYKNLYFVIDLIESYSLDQDSNNQLPPDIGLDASSISAYWIDYSDITDSDGQNIINENFLESDIHAFDDINIDFDELNSTPSKRLFVDKNLGKYYIDLSNQLISEDINNDCAQYDENECNDLDMCSWNIEYGIIDSELNPPEYGVISEECVYLINSINICDNNNLDKLLLISSNSDILYEFASSNYISDYYNTEPYLNILYDEFQELNKTSKKFILDSTIPAYGSTNYYISDTLLYNSNYIFVANLFNEEVIEELSDSLIWSNYTIENPLISQNNLDQEIHLLDISIDLVNVDNYLSSGIYFWLDNIKYLQHIDDAGYDNWNPEDSTGTEGNGLWDIGEYIEDYGLDLCASNFEDGMGGCVSDSTLSAYNVNGTEGNSNWDYGENYYDYGADACPDYYEDSLGGCLCLNLDNCEAELLCEDENMDGLCDDGLDPNLDNYNNDPSQDDWFDVNNDGLWNEGEGLENNNQRDEGEPFLDIGIDGLAEILVGYGDEGESNDIYDFGEPYFDTGIDSLFSINEIGYNITGNQNNQSYQFGEPFDDCGNDSNCDDNDISDDYNIDPNNDNWLDCGSDQICPNNSNYIEPDLDGSELNGSWDQNEGTELNSLHDSIESSDSDYIQEYYEDYGIDNIQDNEELLLNNQKISVSKTDSIFFNYLDSNSQLYDLFGQENDSLKIWISSIQKTSDSNLKISISCLANHDISGIEFQLNHDSYSTQIMDWENKERNVAKVDFNSYINDFTLFNNSYFNISDQSKLFMNYAYGISALLSFDSLGYFIDNNRDIIINENNSYLTLFFEKNNSEFILESDNYMIDVNKIDSTEVSTLFSYFVQNNPDSLIIPIGNLIQQYISNEHDYGQGIVLSLNPNQYPPTYNFNNIILDTAKTPIVEIYYFK